MAEPAAGSGGGRGACAPTQPQPAAPPPYAPSGTVERLRSVSDPSGDRPRARRASVGDVPLLQPPGPPRDAVVWRPRRASQGALGPAASGGGHCELPGEAAADADAGPAAPPAAAPGPPAAAQGAPPSLDAWAGIISASSRSLVSAEPPPWGDAGVGGGGTRGVGSPNALVQVTPPAAAARAAATRVGAASSTGPGRTTPLPSAGAATPPAVPPPFTRPPSPASDPLLAALASVFDGPPRRQPPAALQAAAAAAAASGASSKSSGGSSGCAAPSGGGAARRRITWSDHKGLALHEVRSPAGGRARRWLLAARITAITITPRHAVRPTLTSPIHCRCSTRTGCTTRTRPRGACWRACWRRRRSAACPRWAAAGGARGAAGGGAAPRPQPAAGGARGCRSRDGGWV